ncbi:hypothetical protein [Dechloromonas sp. H13]|uniref:hypothetical protein n=1 Tax=Dechloromonas sp. H13 TaxID=2570193 RepID=UPI00129273DC|nr:hypothetical protein [Dechloromonas sp. H13]
MDIFETATVVRNGHWLRPELGDNGTPGYTLADTCPAADGSQVVVSVGDVMHEPEVDPAAGTNSQRIGKRERRRQRMIGALRGRCCIYKERGCLVLVRVVSVENDGNAFHFFLEVVKRFAGRVPDRFAVAVSAEYLLISPSWSLHAAWVNWTLVTRPDLVGLVEQSFEKGMPTIELVRLVSRIG